MNAETQWTVGQLLTWTTEFLQDKGGGNPRLDAEVLLAYASGCRRIDLYVRFAELADAELRHTFRQLVKQRASGTPVAYLVGHREFYSLEFKVTPDVLIPRPETEFLIVELLDLAKLLDGREPRIADVGTGSGVLAVCAARHLATASVAAIDVSPHALEIARHNAHTHGVESRIQFHHGSLLEPVADQPPFDFIVSNPPYVSQPEFEALMPEVRDHEPRVALVAGPSGTEIIQPLVAQAAERLAPGGWLIFEISPMIEQAVRRIVEAEEAFGDLAITKDLAGHARVVKTRKTVGMLT